MEKNTRLSINFVNHEMKFDNILNEHATDISSISQLSISLTNASVLTSRLYCYAVDYVGLHYVDVCKFCNQMVFYG